MLKIPVNGTPWSLLNKVYQVPECPSALSTQVQKCPSIVQVIHVPKCF